MIKFYKFQINASYNVETQYNIRGYNYLSIFIDYPFNWQELYEDSLNYNSIKFDNNLSIPIIGDIKNIEISKYNFFNYISNKCSATFCPMPSNSDASPTGHIIIVLSTEKIDFNLIKHNLYIEFMKIIPASSNKYLWCGSNNPDDNLEELISFVPDYEKLSIQWTADNPFDITFFLTPYSFTNPIVDIQINQTHQITEVYKRFKISLINNNPSNQRTVYVNMHFYNPY